MKIHIIGIEGAGTSALAQIYVGQGHVVTGSDDGDGFYRKPLKAVGILLYDKFEKGNVSDGIDLVVYSTAFTTENVECVEAQAKKIPCKSYPEAIGDLTNDFYTIAVCGTHGKTTTSGMAAHAMVGAGRDVNALIGAPVIGWKSGARIGEGREFILEADEYQNKLTYYNPQAVILTSIDYDHPDFFPDFATYKQAFADFLMRLPRTGFLVAFYDDWDVISELADVKARIFTYGEHPDADLTITDRVMQGDRQVITYIYTGQKKEIMISLPGKHNAFNAVGAHLMAALITGDPAGSREGISKYRGVKRRFEKRGEYKGALMLDDYAHHPEEVRMTLATAQELYKEKKIIAAFHPHTYTRTKALLHEFGRALDIADEVIVLDIYGSAREAQGGVSASDLVDAVNQNAQKKAHHIPDIAALSEWAKKNLGKDDVFMTLGAGDIYKVHDSLK